MFLPSRLGERGTALSELALFRQVHWRSLLEHAGLVYVASRPTGLFYTGNTLFGARIHLSTRRRLSTLLQSSSYVFVMRKPGQ
jgi:hypothetical protein